MPAPDLIGTRQHGWPDHASCPANLCKDSRISWPGHSSSYRQVCMVSKIISAGCPPACAKNPGSAVWAAATATGRSAHANSNCDLGRGLNPSKLHDLRSCTVNNTRLACVAVTLELHTLLLHASPSLSQDVDAFATHLGQLTAQKASGLSCSAPEVGHAGMPCMHSCLRSVPTPRYQGQAASSVPVRPALRLLGLDAPDTSIAGRILAPSMQMGWKSPEAGFNGSSLLAGPNARSFMLHLSCRADMAEHHASSCCARSTWQN